MLYIDVKYANLLSTRLRNFKKTDEYVWNFACPFCGDSSKNKLKSRGYIYRKKGSLFSHCHNCGKGASLGNLVKQVDSQLYNEYVLDRYKDGVVGNKPHKSVKEVIPEFKFRTLLQDTTLKGLKSIDKLDPAHPAVKYCLKRQIPKEKWQYLYFCPQFKRFVNSITPKFLVPITGDHPRLILPYFTNEGKVFAFQGRAFGKEDPKYMTIKIDEERERIYGLDRVDYSKRVYVVEGPIDSLFLPNGIAVSGSSFDCHTIRSLLTNATIIMDNEPRSKEIVKLLSKNIDLGYSICLWPDTVKEKDINEMILAGKTPAEILKCINDNTYSGIEAKLKFTEWRKC